MQVKHLLLNSFSKHCYLTLVVFFILGATYAQPPGNRSLYFDGIDVLVSVSHDAVFDIDTEVTYEAWVKLASDSNGGEIFRKVEAATEGKRVIVNSDRTVRFLLVGGVTGDVDISTTSQLQPNEWTHVACTFEEDVSAKIYFDGVEQVSIVPSSDPKNGTGDVRISVLTDTFHGQIDEVKVFNTFRTAAEVLTDMSSTDTNTAGLVAYWDFEDDVAPGNQTVAEDVTANTNDGTLTGNAGRLPRWSLSVTDNTDNGGAGLGSLRQAITEANTDTDKDYIDFNILGGGVQTIFPSTGFPTIDQPLVLDGYTQPGSSPNTLMVGNDASLQIQLAGGAGGVLSIAATNSEVYGLIIHGFGAGILISGTDNTIAGCQIGLDASGNPSANVHGIYVQADDVTIGLPTPAGRNTISGNQFNGILIQNADWVNTRVQNNYLGTNPDGLSAPSPNQQRGIRSFGSSSLYGGTTALERNVFSGNVDSGLSFARASGSDNNIVLGNFIGVGADGTTPLGNAGSGIQFFADDIDNHQIGGIQAGEGNLIANNAIGIFLGGTTSTGNTIRGNSIFGNTTIGIDLAPTGANTNDPDDADAGNNNLQNFPLINSVQVSGGNLAINFSVDATIANSAYGATGLKIDFYQSDGNRQGEVYLGTIDYPEGSAQSSFTGFFPLGTIVGGDVIVATATDDNGNTSEFSEEFNIVNNLPTAANNTLVVNEDEVFTIITADFNYNDIDSDPFTLINITSIPAQGTLYVDADNDDTFDAGEELVDNNQVLIADLNAGNLQFIGSANGNGTPFASFSFNVNDGLGNSSPDNTITINVIAVNDAPVISAQANALSTDEDTDLTVQLADVTVTDPDHTFPDDFSLTVQAGTNYSFSGNTITPATHFNGILSVPVIVNDGADNSPPFDLAMTVNPVNDVPSVDTNTGLILSKGSIGTIGTSQLSSSDFDNTALELTYTMTTNPISGRISFSSFTQQDIIDGHVTYTHDDSENFSDTFSFSLSDGTNTTISQVFNIEIGLDGGELPDLEVLNAVTPNGDGIHDFLRIENIELYPDNQMQVFSRFGQIVFDIRGYDNDQIVFEGRSNLGNRRTLNNGTYYYLIDDGVNKKKHTGFFVLAK